MTPPGRRAHSGRAGRRRGSGHPEERSGRSGRERGDTRQVRGGRDQGRESRSTPGGPARYAAYQAVAAVHRDDAYANLALPAILARAGLSGRDAALATELTYGTLRRQGTLDEIIAAVADRPVSRIDPPVRDALRLGAYQLLYTRVPAHAAVSATVGLVKTVAPGATGFANAVLRKVSAEPLDAWLARLAPAYQTDPIGNLALTYSHPPWVVRAFSDSLGGDLAEVARLLAENNEPAPVHLCARPGRAEATTLADEVGGAPGAFSPYAVYLAGGHPGDLPAVASGRAHVQDEGSQLVTVALTEVLVSEGPAEQWLDLCAGPGGKAALRGGLAAQRGVTVTAVEVAAHRAELVERAVAGLPVTVRQEDGRTIGQSDPGRFARVLVDAPCTGLGALRRRPEARWRRHPSDLPALTRLQRELLVAAIAATRPGGVVAYATCSPHLAETVVTVAEAQRRSPHPTTLLDARPYLPGGMPGLGEGPTVQLWPHRHGTDAMFLALIRRTG